MAIASMMLAVMSIQIARAQAAPPIGVWVNAGQVNTLVVQQNGACGFKNKVKVLYSGTCKWETPSARGGILDLVYPMPLQPGHIRWSIVYINQTTITVAGEKFTKLAQ